MDVDPRWYRPSFQVVSDWAAELAAEHPDPAVQGDAARIAVWLPVLIAARETRLRLSTDADNAVISPWRDDLPHHPAGTVPLAIVTATHELATGPHRMWEPFVAADYLGPAAAPVAAPLTAAGAWHQDVTTLLLNAAFLADDTGAADAMVRMAMRHADATATASHNLAIGGPPEAEASWPGDTTHLDHHMPPFYWQCGTTPETRTTGKFTTTEFDPEALRAACAKFAAPQGDSEPSDWAGGGQ